MVLDNADLIITGATIIVHSMATMKTFIIKNTIKRANFLLIAVSWYLLTKWPWMLKQKRKKTGNQRERKTSQLSTNGKKIKLTSLTSFNSIIPPPPPLSLTHRVQHVFVCNLFAQILSFFQLWSSYFTFWCAVSLPVESTKDALWWQWKRHNARMAQAPAAGLLNLILRLLMFSIESCRIRHPYRVN